MKNVTFTSMLLSCLLAISFPLFGQNSEEIGLAIEVLKGKDMTKDKEWAINLLLESQKGRKDAYVQNVLGIAYLHGLGILPDTAKAISYFEESAELGYSLAYHNLGMYYKYAGKAKQDFTKSYEIFAKGADAKEPNCCYNCGFMKYKGLGCKQDYVVAIERFCQAAEFNHIPSIYMIGLCFRNGYGVEADSAVGNYYLRMAADFGYEDAIEELLNDEPENKSILYYSEANECSDTPLEMPNITPYIPLNNKIMSGDYHGIIVTYDWSGENVVSEKPLSVSMNIVRDSAKGVWIQGVDTISFEAAVGNDGSMLFINSEKEMFDRYSHDYISKYNFESASLNYHMGYIVGRLRLYNNDEMEPDRPMFISMSKDIVDCNDLESDEYARIVAYSDPYSHRITLKFELSQSAPSAQISIYDRNSLNVGNFKYGSLDAGVNTITIAPNLREGYYVIYVVAGNEKFQAVVVV